jgi:hypothetical protein
MNSLAHGYSSIFSFAHALSPTHFPPSTHSSTHATTHQHTRLHRYGNPYYVTFDVQNLLGMGTNLIVIFVTIAFVWLDRGGHYFRRACGITLVVMYDVPPPFVNNDMSCVSHASLR